MYKAYSCIRLFLVVEHLILVVVLLYFSRKHILSIIVKKKTVFASHTSTTSTKHIKLIYENIFIFIYLYITACTNPWKQPDELGDAFACSRKRGCVFRYIKKFDTIDDSIHFEPKLKKVNIRKDSFYPTCTQEL